MPKPNLPNSLVLLVLLIISAVTANAQVGIGTNTPATSAQLEVSSTSKGFLPPRMTVAQKSAITTPAQGLIIYCTDCGANGEPEYFNGSTWLNMAGNAVAKATPTVSISVGTYTYSGAAQGPNVATNTGTGTVYTYSYVGTGTTTYVSSATRPINAGSYNVTVTLSASSDGNYATASSNATAFTITKAAPTVTPVIGTYSYNSASPVAQGPTAATNTGTGTVYSYSYSGTGFTTYGPTATKPTDGGTYTVTATVAASSNGNYVAASSNATAFRISTSLSIADSYGGGKVAYILQSGDTGYDAAQQHGLIISGDLTASFTDIIWGTKDVVTGATGGGENVDTNNYQSVDLGSGINNTNIIIASEGAGTTYAAGLARAYRGGGYTNWYLPSYGEWAAMQYWRASFTFNRGAYWTSTEYLDIWAYRWVRGSGIGIADKNFANAGVCAVRCF